MPKDNGSRKHKSLNERLSGRSAALSSKGNVRGFESKLEMKLSFIQICITRDLVEIGKTPTEVGNQPNLVTSKQIMNVYFCFA